jgi:hypothetical protein
MADADAHIPFRSNAVTLLRPCHSLERSLLKGVFVAWKGKGMVCVNQTWPHCVNQMGKTQSEVLAERTGRGTAWYCELALKNMIRLTRLKFWNVGKLEAFWCCVKG